MSMKHIVRLSDDERTELSRLISSGEGRARKIAHARILLKADRAPGGPAWEEERIAEAVEMSVSTVENVKKKYVTEGMDAALNRKKPSNVVPRKFDGETEAHLVALTCGAAPEGRDRWTLRLLADRMVVLDYAKSMSHESVRKMLKKTGSSRGRGKNT